MTSESRPPEDPWESQGPPPEWVGDISAGVDAWTRRATPRPVDRLSTAQAQRTSTELVEAHQPERPVEEDPEPDHESVARKILLDELTGRARSRKELAEKLAKRRVPDEIATRLLDRFEEVGLVDDEAFARSWVATRQGSKGLARRALAQELRRKGVDDETARGALDEIDPEQEQTAARALVRKRLRSMAGLDAATQTRRLLGMLARKGYPPSTAFAVVRDEVGDSDVAMPESDG